MAGAGRSTDEQVAELLEGRDPATVTLARAVRDLVHEVDPDVVEVPWPHQGTIGWGIGPKKYTEHYAYLAVHPRHVNLGFNQGAELPDPTGLLAGPGKSLRHHRFDRVDQLADPAIRDLLVAARAHRSATAHSTSDPATPRP